ncbi:MAG: DUF2971 domain-containing protein [Planctomycetaceae bacterium]
MRQIWDDDPNEDEALWRYFKTARFITFLETSHLYFAAATQFEDRFEGCVAVQSPEYKTDPRYAEKEHAEEAFAELKRLTKISCWHRADYESYAMWKLYAEFHKGVAVETTVHTLVHSVAPFNLQPNYGEETLLGGAIRYTDMTQVRLKTSMEKRFFHKHQAFAWEREYRLAISVRNAEEFGVSVPSEGILVSVDPSRMIKRIILGPRLPESERETITNAANAAGLSDRVALSSLLYNPRYV